MTGRGARAPVFDGHNDLLLKLWRAGSAAGFAAGDSGHVDAEKARAGGLAGGLCAIYVPGDDRIAMDMFQGDYDIPLPDPIAEAPAAAIAVAQAALLLELDRRGDVALCRSVADIRAAMDAGRFAAVMHLEGAEAIGPDLAMLDLLHAAGLRSVGPVWSRPTIFGHGVPFTYPGDPDRGPGLTADGKRLIARAAALRMIVDVSHLNAAGVRDVAEAGLPVVASHSNAHAIAPHSRNLTDAQLDLVRQSRGIVGLNFASAFLRPDGQMDPAGALAHMIPHLEHMLARAGEDHVGLGSDFDGATVPVEIGSAAGLDVLRDAMAAAGWDAALIAKVCHENWLACLARTWGG